ncbi:MAG: 23S rRNA (guanosine(2251)-2'-O)-methyltransferase RlmB [bacterium]
MSETIEGKNAVLEALKSGRPILHIYLSKSLRPDEVIDEIKELAKNRNIPFDFMERDILERGSTTKNSQGVIAQVGAQKYYELHELLENPQNDNPFLLILDEIEDPGNLGAILRTADAAGVDGIIIPKRRSVGLNQTVAKTSAGAIEYVKVAQVTNINQAISELKDQGIQIIGSAEDGHAKYTDIDLKGPIAIVIGSEGHGMRRLTKERCDQVVKIPMKGKISSLNASVSAAIMMYEVVRQRSS